MKKFYLRLSLAMFLILAIALPISAHTPILYVEDLFDGTIYMQGGFSDGSSASGIELLIVENKDFDGSTSALDDYLKRIGADTDLNEKKIELFENKLILYKTTLDRFGEAIVTKPDSPYLVVFNGGVGHIVVKPGPKLTPQEI